MDKKTEMQVERITPTHALTPFEEMERFFDEPFTRRWMWNRPWSNLGRFTHSPEYLSPRVDLIDRDDDLVVSAEIPGVKKEDVDISLTETTLTLHGSNSREVKEEEGDYYYREIARGEFSRTISLPCMVDTEKACAKFFDGVLEVTIPKLSKSKRKHIPVS